MSSESDDLGHGSSPAAWTAVVIMLTAVAIGTVAFFFDFPLVVFGSVALFVIGLLVGFVMAKLGFGVNGRNHAPGS